MANGEMGSLLAMEIIGAVSSVYNWPVFEHADRQTWLRTK